MASLDYENDYHRRVEHVDDPERCQRGTPHGPCPYKHLPNSQYCAVHGGMTQVKQEAKKQEGLRLAAQWQVISGQFANDPELKSLKQELGIVRMLLMKTMERCHSDNDLLLRSSTILEIISRSERLVLSCNTLDTKLGVMLDKTQLAAFGTKVVNLIATLVTDPTIIAKVADGLIALVQEAGQPETRARDSLTSNYFGN